MRVVYFNEDKTKVFEWWSKDGTVGDVYFKERETPDDVWSPPKLISREYGVSIPLEKFDHDDFLARLGYTIKVVEE